MPVFALTEDNIFPDPRLAEDGIIAVGGDLNVDRLLAAYATGIFPWYNQDEPVIWWSPDPRFVLSPSDIHVSRSMRKIIRDGIFDITLDQAFDQVIRGCRMPRKEQQGTWITDQMLSAYNDLHHAGFAHSVEVWKGDELAGGLYGVSLGGMFFGESMFSRESNASKTALVYLARGLEKLNFDLIDCQVYTPHLESMGATYMDRELFLSLLGSTLRKPALTGSWEGIEAFKDPVI